MSAIAESVDTRTRPANALGTPSGCQDFFNDLLELPPSEFAKHDLGLLNLLCAPNLPGSEKLEIPHCLSRLDNLVAFVRAGTERNLHRFRSDPDYGRSEPMWRMALLVTLVKRDFGAAYSPAARADLAAGIDAPITDAREVFIHGLLDDDPARRWGTCSSIPVLVTAVARGLGYPVRLAVARRHCYARWEGDGTCFNIEASGPQGMTVETDDHYHSFRGGLTSQDRESGYYIRSLLPVEEFALFFKDRVWCLTDAARYDETLLWSARALQFSPDDPLFPSAAAQIMDTALKHRHKQLHPGQRIPPPDDPNPFFFKNVGELLNRSERSLFLTIAAHHKESKGELHEAREFYENACRQNFHGNNEQRDLQRFLRKHGIPKRRGPLLPPTNLGFNRRFRLACPPDGEAEALRRLAAEFERRGELRDARDALHDLYMFDPCDAEVFDRAREIERRPLFQEQSKNVR